MNHIYRSIWNSTLGCWVAAPETARTGGGLAGNGVCAAASTFLPRRHALAIAIGAVLALVGSMPSAYAACTALVPSGTVTCSGDITGLKSSVNNLVVNVESDAQINATILAPGAINLAGNNISFNNAGTVDPSLLGAISLMTSGASIGNTNNSIVKISNTGIIKGTAGLVGGTLVNLRGMALNVQNGSGGTTTVINSGTIGSSALLGLSVLASDSPVVAISGGGKVNFTNTGSIIGRVAMEASSSGNVFTNVGSLSGSLSLGAGAGANTFNAITGSSVQAGGGLGVFLPVTSANLSFAATGIVDGGAGSNSVLALQNAVGGGVGTAGSGWISSDNFKNFSNLIVDAGTWTMNGAVLTGASTSTTLNGGILRINNDAALGTGTITSAGAGGNLQASVPAVTLNNLIDISGTRLTVSGDNKLTLDGAISGSGALVKTGSGTLALSGANSYTGGTDIQAGTLALGAGGSLSATSALSLSGAGSTFDMSSGGNQTVGALDGAAGSNIVLGATTLTFGSARDKTFAGAISGTGGGLIKNGSGTMELSGNSTYTGGTQVNAGILVAANNSALGAGDVTVKAGASLEVTSGTTLGLDGDLTFQSGSFYRVYADPNSATSSRIDVTGTANLAGSVVHVGAELDGATDFQVGKTYTILHAAGGLAGSKFGASFSQFAYLNTTLGYTTTDVTLKLERKGSSTGGGSMGFAELANTPNQGGAANAIENLPSTHPLYQYVETLPAGTPAAVFSVLSGDTHSTVSSSVNMLSAQAPNISQQHLRSNLTSGFRPGASIAQSDGPLPASAFPSSKALPAWVEVVGHWQKMDGNSNTPGVKQNTTGLFLGADEEVGNSGWRVGGSVGYTNADAKVSSRDASADISSYSAAVYTGKGFSHGANRINVIGGLAYTKHSIESERSVAALNQNLKADYSAHTAQLFAEVGYAMGQYDKQGFEPFVGITLGEQRTNSFKESGGFAALSSESSRDTLASTTLGVRAHSDFVVAGKDTRVRGTLGVRHAWGKLSQNRTMAFEGSSSFTVAGAPLARNTALVGLQAEMALSRYSALVLGYNGEYGSGSRDQSASVKVRWAF